VESRQGELEILTSLLLVLAVALQAAGREGTVAGTMTFNGLVVPVRHVYASAQPGFFDRTAEDVHVLLSDRPLADRVRADTFEILRVVREERAHVLEVVIDATGQPISGSIFVPEVDGMISATGMHVFTREALEPRRIAGRLAVAEPHTFMSLTWQYSATFSAPIPRPPTDAERAASLATPPAEAAARYVAAVRDGDFDRFVSTLTGPEADGYRRADGRARFDQLRTDMPKDTRVVSLEPQTDGSVIATVEGHDGTVVVAYELRVVPDATGWKIKP
jgi:hypothetical protein